MNNIESEKRLINAAKRLSEEVGTLTFSAPVTVVYNPLEYAWKPHAFYLGQYGSGKKKAVFLGMNPGPWGMAQTGVPFGEVDAVKNWLKIDLPVDKPNIEHPKRPIDGFLCPHSEVSGRRLWGLFKERFGEPEKFFEEHFVANYCPLAFMEAGGRNRTPDKLKTNESVKLFAACDHHLREVVEILEPEWLVGVGRFTETSARRALAGMNVRIGQILHPSPASPIANHGWADIVARQLKELGIWQ
ncbi:MAG: single-stranded DNA-binding protein [Acidobacteria bacterium]|jgi:single-strand selective monofunctional uracil DNA glycosylase|nr:single-stranded DNA-binding protein [Acidobacteriota bacterium]